MALSKSRNNRRSSSSSYAPALIVLVVIAVSVLAVWRIKLNPVDQPQKRSIVARAAIIDTSDSETQNDISSSIDSAEITSGGHDQTINLVREDGTDHLSNDAIKSDDDTLNSDANQDPHDDRSFTNEAQVPEGDTLTQNQEASKTNEADGDNDRHHPDAKMSESEEVQGSSISDEASEGSRNNVEGNAGVQDENSDMKENKNKEDQNGLAKEIQELNTEQQPDVRKFDNQDENSDTKENKNVEDQNDNANERRELNLGKRRGVNDFNNQESKNDEDEQNEEQLREDKGDITEEDEKQQDQKQQSNSNPYQDLDTHSTSTASQLESHAALENEDESSKQTKTKFEQDTKIPELGEKKRTSGNKNAKQSKESKSWSTQADESQNENERRGDESKTTESESLQDYTWRLCNVTANADYIPCLDNEKALKRLHSTKHYEHRERHCPEDAPTCLVPLPKGYKTSIEWPSSRDKIWYYNVPYTLLAEVKGHQNWVKVTGEFLTFPGGGTQFIHGALHYIDFIQEAEANIAWGKRTRVILDVGCGVGSLGGYLFERDVLAMSFAPKDEHVAQVQFAIERGIPAISAVMGSQRLPFPSMVFDLVHCARCRVPWHADGGLLLLELNRVLRPGGYFVWSATPVYQKLQEDVQIWNEMSSLTKSMCWELVTISKDKLNSIGAAIYRKPTSNECYEQRKQNIPPICNDNDDPNASWYVPLQACLHKVPVNKDERGARWPQAWPNRLRKVPYWLNDLQTGIYGKPASQDFVADTERWENVLDELNNVGITWSNVRNIMDMRAVYGGFAAALRELPVWVMNVVNIDSPDTLPIIYERGLFGIYHDWCESFSTYPRTYDLLHADGLFSKLKNRCNLVPVMAEVDRIARPGGKLIIRDDSDTLGEMESLLRSLHWEITSKSQEGLLFATKGMWRPNSTS